MGYLPDTNILINYLKGLDPEKDYFKKIITSEKLFFSPLVAAEYFAKAKEEEIVVFKELLTLGTVIPIDVEVALVAGSYRKKFSKKTKKVYLIDCLIAATCKIYNLTLITNNIKDYPMKDIKIIEPLPA